MGPLEEKPELRIGGEGREDPCVQAGAGHGVRLGTVSVGGRGDRAREGLGRDLLGIEEPVSTWLSGVSLRSPRGGTRACEVGAPGGVRELTRDRAQPPAPCGWLPAGSLS